MRTKKEQHPMFEEKGFISEDESVLNQAACLNRIYRKVNYEGLTADSIQELRDDIDYVAEFYHIDNQSAVLLAAILEKSATNNLMDDEDLAQYLGCTNIEFISFRKYLQSLAQKRIVRIGRNRGGDATYQVMPEACEAIVNDTAFSEKSFAGLTTEDMFSEFRKLFIAFRNDEIDKDILISDLNMLIDANPQNDFSQKVLECGIRQCSESEQRIFLYLCHHYVSWGDKEMDFRHLGNFISDKEDEQKFFRFFQAEKHGFQKRGLIRFGGEEGLMD